MIRIPSERVRHALVAILIAGIIAASTILRPVDILLWSIQSKLFDREASGEIVFVQSNLDDRYPDDIGRGRILVEAAEKIAEAGATKIYIGWHVQDDGTADLSDDLLDRLAPLADRIVFVQTNATGTFSQNDRRFLNELTNRNLPVATSDLNTDFLGYAWDIEARAEVGELVIPSLAFALSKNSSGRDSVSPDYAIDPSSVPTFDLKALVGSKKTLAIVSGKTIVMDAPNSSTAQVRIPETGEMAGAMAHILGAETLAYGSGQRIDWFPIIGVLGTLLLVGLKVFPSKPWRTVFYSALSIMPVALFYVMSALSVRAILSGGIVLLFVFGILRLIARYKRRHLLVDQRSKLPNFSALLRDLADLQTSNLQVVIVAKIARLDAIFAKLTPAYQTQYLRQVADRLALRDKQHAIYYDGGKYFAFTIERSAFNNLQGHLEGLRAISCQPVSLGNELFDVSITIGVDDGSELPIDNRLSSAIAAADQAREAYKPVFIIGDQTASKENWDYSLQARLEQALSDDNISIRLQPQFDIATSEIVAAEALARWHDVEKGEVPPSDFIWQCERVGRLDELTNCVAGKVFDAIDTLAVYDDRVSLSFNVSAIQFVDHRIADLITQKLVSHAIDPRRITIELTETARIEDMGVARDVLQTLKTLGVQLAMDDFGIESANLETMLALPFDEIKIDRAFVSQMTQSAKANAIVKNAIHLIKDAGMTSVAEGIEDRQTFDLLHQIGCDLGQGFYLAKPLTYGEFKEMLDLQRGLSVPIKKYG